MITYVMSILSAAEAKKTTISKRITQSQTLVMKSDSPWDTMKAQILAKISLTLDPSTIDFDHYDIKFYINRVFPKPGLSLASESDYDIMTSKASKAKDPVVNITVVQKPSKHDKENDTDRDEGEVIKGKKKTVRYT
jgi:hypothetical protein